MTEHGYSVTWLSDRNQWLSACVGCGWLSVAVTREWADHEGRAHVAAAKHSATTTP